MQQDKTHLESLTGELLCAGMIHYRQYQPSPGIQSCFQYNSGKTLKDVSQNSLDDSKYSHVQVKD